MISSEQSERRADTPPRVHAVRASATAPRQEIVLIGPVRAGKSTVANLLSARLGVPCVGVEQHRWRYYAESGYDRARARTIQQTEGFAGLYRYMRRFEAEAVRRVLEEHRGCVFDFGPSHTVQEEAELFAIVQAALRPFANVVLLLPSPDPLESIRVLNERTGGLCSGGIDFVDHFVRHRSGHVLAKIRVYTEGRTPEQTRDEIVERCAGPSPRRLSTPAPERSPIVAARSADASDATIDVSTWTQHRELACLRLPDPSGWLSRAARDDDERVRRELERLRGVVDRPLCELSRRFVNDCFAEVDAVVEGALLKARIAEDARVRAAKLYAHRLPRGATLRDALAVDPLHGVRPVGDAQPLALLARPEAPTRVRAAQRASLQERFLRRPQRSRYPFLHEVIVGHFSNLLDGGGVKARSELRLADIGNPLLAAHFVAMLSRVLDRPTGEVAALHFADNETIERELPQSVRELLLVAAQVGCYLESLVVHRWREGARRMTGDVLLFFAIPALERIAAGRGGSLVRDAGWRLSEVAARLLSAGEPNETDVVAALMSLAETLWSPVITDDFAPPPSSGSGFGRPDVSLLVL